MSPPAEGPKGWSPWAPRPGSDVASPASRPTVPAVTTGPADLPTTPPTHHPWGARDHGPAGPTSPALPARPPLRDPEGLPPGLAPRPPTTWGRPKPAESDGEPSAEDAR